MNKKPDFDPSQDYYRQLEVSEHATADEIKRSYRTLAKQLHPDSAGADKVKEARFKEISVAYGVVGDADKRAYYDHLRRHPSMPIGSGSPPWGGGDPDMTEIGDLFASFFRNDGGTRSRTNLGRDRGRSDPMRDRDRDRERPRRSGSRIDQVFDRVSASDGSWLAVDGEDVSSEVRISFDRAILGTVVRVPTIDGIAEVKIPPGTSSGRRMRLRGKGIGFGDHYVTVQIDVPEAAADDTIAKLEQLVAILRKPGQS